MHPLRCLLAALALLPASLLSGQNQEASLQQILQRLDQGESAEQMTILLGDVNFATGTATLEPAAKTYLGKVAQLLRLAPNMDLFIVGHADNTGTAAVNEKLSESRAADVRTYLIEQGVEAGRLSFSGFGSAQPVASNDTPEGRAKNRRVEMEVLKKETVKTMQDIIVMRNGNRIGAMVSGYDDKVVAYRQFSNDSELEIGTRNVEKIIFADGRVVYFDQAEQTVRPASKPRSPFRPFAESEAFHKGQFVIGVGYGLKSNIGIGYGNSSVSLPPLWMVAEIPLGYNLGVGLSVGAMQWAPKGGDGGARYGYYTLSPRLAYHFNLGSKLDLYTGFSFDARLGALALDRNGSNSTFTKFKAGFSLLGGVRYYFARFLGVYGEYGGDTVSCYRVGLAFRFGR